MKNIYVDSTTFACHLQQNTDGTLLPVQTSVFDVIADEDIQNHMFVPLGYTYYDSLANKHYSGEFVQPLPVELQKVPDDETRRIAEAALAQATYTAMMTDTLAGEV